jgi:hypothetical protein
LLGYDPHPGIKAPSRYDDDRNLAVIGVRR